MAVAPATLEQDEEEEAVTATIKEFENIKTFEKFHKCRKCQKRVSQGANTKIATCPRCGIIKITNCGLGISASVAVKVENRELTLKMGDQILKKILNHDVIDMDDKTLTEELLFTDKQVTVTYSSNYIVKDIV